MLEIVLLVSAGLAIFCGAVLQGATGIGLALIATPIIQLIEPTLMPGAMLIVAFGLAVLTTIQEARFADWHGLTWALAGRVVGTAASAWIIVLTAPKTLDLINGLTIMAVTIMVALAPSTLPRNPFTLVGSGMFAGVAGTTASLGGPLIALVYHRSPGPELRGSLGIFYTAGTLLSLGCLALVGGLRWIQIVGGLTLAPFMVAGFFASAKLRHHFDRKGVRGAILILAGTASIALVIRSLLR
ncbi:sulfite exporter TauE/SafE family protein [Nonomuraea sp. NBC_01738]|uniref:sulfite exporter TauE/SafE family protein n=1 Tax=Nonomuraea sp. NBC_01738 TaxID=2976003 RepID=UPI002E14607E|nr:sulfite exporter TauE/SafE family protein [Nonomuraea sp. NBC_01738]